MAAAARHGMTIGNGMQNIFEYRMAAQSSAGNNNVLYVNVNHVRIVLLKYLNQLKMTPEKPLIECFLIAKMVT